MYSNSPDYSEAKAWTNKDVDFIDIDLSTARTSVKPEKFDLGGKKIYVSLKAWDDKFTISTSKTVGVATVTLNSKEGTPLELIAGQSYDLRDYVFDNIWVRNTAQSGAMIRLYTSIETNIAPYSNETKIVGETPSSVKVENPIASISPSTNTLAYNTDSTIKRRILCNESHQSVYYLGDDGALTKGPIIPALGGTLVIESGAAVYLKAIGGTVSLNDFFSINHKA